MSKTVLANIDGFTPVIDSLVADVGLMTAVVFGRMWRFCQMEDGVCKAKLETIGEGIGVDKATVMRHAEKLCDTGYLRDLTPDLKNRPHVYADTGKAGLNVNISSVAQSNVTLQSATSDCRVQRDVAESHLNKEYKTDSKTETKKDIVDGILDYHLKPKAIKDAIRDYFKLTPNWETKFNRQFMQWAVAEDVQPAQIKSAAALWVKDKRFNWSVATLKGIQEHWLELMNPAPVNGSPEPRGFDAIRQWLGSEVSND